MAPTSTSRETSRNRSPSSRAVAAAALCLALCAGASADEWKHDGPELARFAADYEKLRDSGAATDDPSVAARVAYFTGFVLGVARANADRAWYCLPGDLLAWHTWDAVAKFVREHPEFWERRPSTIVNGALAKAYPCTEAARAARQLEDKPDLAPAPKPAAKPRPARKPPS